MRHFRTDGEVAQLVEHHVRNVGVGSSNLLFSTIPKVCFTLDFILSHSFEILLHGSEKCSNNDTICANFKWKELEREQRDSAF